MTSRTSLPPGWDKGVIAERLSHQLDDHYERFMRKFEDYFKNTELEFIVLLIPSNTMVDFKTFLWGVGTMEERSDGSHTLLRFYQGTKLRDLGAWDAKVLEKQSDIITPTTLFPEGMRRQEINFDRTSQRELCDRLVEEWGRFKALANSSRYRKPSLEELYLEWKQLV